jgi:hypothetical protein
MLSVFTVLKFAMTFFLALEKFFDMVSTSSVIAEAPDIDRSNSAV